MTERYSSEKFGDLPEHPNGRYVRYKAWQKAIRRIRKLEAEVTALTLQIAQHKGECRCPNSSLAADAVEKR